MFYTPSSRCTPHKPTGAKLALKPFHVWGIRVRLQVARRIRDLALFDLALDCKLRGCDLMGLGVSAFFPKRGENRGVLIIQKKTGGPAQLEGTKQPRRSVAAWIEGKQLGSDDWL